MQETGAYHSFLCFVGKLSSRIDFFYAVPEGCWTTNDKIPADRVGVFRFVELSKSWSIIWYLPQLIINTLKIRKWLKQQAIEIVHVNDLYNMIGVCLKLLTPEIKLIYHVRLRRSSYVKPLFNSWVWVISKVADTIIPVSETVYRDLVVQPGKALRIYDAVDDFWQPLGSPDKNRGRLRLLYVSNYIPGKGQDYALEAFKIVYSHQPNVTLRLVGVTGGQPENERYLSSLKQFILNNKLQNLVTIVDQPSDIRHYMAMSDVLLMFSESESFSLVCLEALACGRPVIATKCGGPEEIIRHQTNGILVDNRDINAMAGAILKLCSNPDIVARFSTNSRIDFNDKFNPNILADQLYKIYKDSPA